MAAARSFCLENAPGFSDSNSPQNLGRQELMPKFFKIVLNPETPKLKIPQKFTRSLGPANKLPNRVYLEVPSGPLCAVAVVHDSNGEAWLGEGWRRFRDYYSIGYGYFLAFSYNGNTRFDVNIFDTSAVEIDYPLLPNIPHDAGTGNTRKVKDPNSAVDASAADDHDDDARQEKRRRILDRQAHVGLRSTRGSATILALDSTISPAVKTESMHAEEEINKEKKEAAVHQPMRRRSSSFKYALDKEGSSTTVPYPSPPDKLRFVAVMRPSYVCRYCNLALSHWFARISFPRAGTSNRLFLRVWEQEEGKEKEWVVKCVIKENHKALLTSGWESFVADNALKVDDSCIFEIPDKTKHQWFVQILRS